MTSRSPKKRAAYLSSCETIKTTLEAIKSLLSWPDTIYPLDGVWIDARKPLERLDAIAKRIPTHSQNAVDSPLQRIDRTCFSELLAETGAFKKLALANVWANDYARAVSQLLPLARQANGETKLADWRYRLFHKASSMAPILRHKDPYWVQYQTSVPSELHVKTPRGVSRVPLDTLVEDVRRLVTSLPELDQQQVILVRNQMERPSGGQSWDRGTHCEFELGNASCDEITQELVWELINHPGRIPEYLVRVLPASEPEAEFIEVRLPPSNYEEFPHYSIRACRRATSRYAVFRAISPP